MLSSQAFIVACSLLCESDFSRVCVCTASFGSQIVLVENHPILRDVSASLLGGGIVEVDLAAGALELASWDDGIPLVAVQGSVGDNVVAVNLQYDVERDSDPSGPVLTLLTNALLWVAQDRTCAACLLAA